MVDNKHKGLKKQPKDYYEYQKETKKHANPVDDTTITAKTWAIFSVKKQLVI